MSWPRTVFYFTHRLSSSSSSVHAARVSGNRTALSYRTMILPVSFWNASPADTSGRSIAVRKRSARRTEEVRLWSNRLSVRKVWASVFFSRC